MARYHRTDAGCEAIYDALEARGATVLRLNGAMDAAVLLGQRMALVDAKGSARTPVTKTQQQLLRCFPDLCFLLYDPTDAQELLARLRGC
jgi:hypothetical protein